MHMQCSHIRKPWIARSVVFAPVRHVLSVIVTSLLLLTVLSGCTAKTQPAGTATNAPAANPAPAGKKMFSIATGPSTAAYYALGAGIGQMVKKHSPEYSLSVQSTGGSSENIRLVGGGKADFGIVMPDSAYFGYKGQGSYKEALPDLRAVMTGHPSLHHLVTIRDDINSVADLKGKKVALGNPGSDAILASKAILEAYGLKEGDYTAQALTYQEQAEAMKDGTLDAGFIMSGIPVAAVTDLAVTKPVKLIPLDPEKLDAIIKANPYWAKGTIPANTYKNQSKAVPVLAAPSILVAHKSVPDDFVYTLIKTVVEFNAELTATHAAGKFWDLDGITDSMAIPLHPGAAKYLTEKGVAIPANIKP